MYALWQLTLTKNIRVRQDNIVCLIVSRSEYMIISILATLKLGAIYLPIDVRYPSKRIQSIIDDTKSHLLITDQEIDNITIKNLLSIKLNWSNILNQAICKSDFQTCDYAYIIYTSGSSGTPKGILVEAG